MSEPLKKPAPSSVKFITERGSSFRIFHADGAWGMTTADDNIQLNFYIERPPFPKVVTQPIDEKGTTTDHMEVIDEIEESDDEIVIVRDYQSAIIMSLDSARLVHRILGNFLKETEDAVPKSNE